MDNDKTKYVSTGWVGNLGVAFVVLKLCKVIDWSWWWVTAPFWGQLAIAIFLFIIIFLAKAIEESM